MKRRGKGFAYILLISWRRVPPFWAPASLGCELGLIRDMNIVEHRSEYYLWNDTAPNMYVLSGKRQRDSTSGTRYGQTSLTPLSCQIGADRKSSRKGRNLQNSAKLEPNDNE